MGTSITILFFWLLFGAICFEMAKTRGRNRLLGFASGLLFGPFTIIYYLLAGNSNEKQIEIMRKAINRDNERV